MNIYPQIAHEAVDFNEALKMLAHHDKAQDQRRYERRLEQQRLRTHEPNRKGKRKQAQRSRRRNR